jgi:phospholipid/cholesterol/gamma-HCH transport system permease protein
MIQKKPSLSLEAKQNQSYVKLKGPWVIHEYNDLTLCFQKILDIKENEIILDFEGVHSLDSSVALMIFKTLNLLQKNHKKVNFVNDSPFQDMFKLVEQTTTIPEPKRPLKRFFLKGFVEGLGKLTLDLLGEAINLFSFAGYLFTERFRLFLTPQYYKWAATFHHLARTGFEALPIVGLLTFLVGVVLAYQGAVQLERFGAEIYTVNLLGVSILREIGILLTAIIVAGRSGSAFTAQIGTMKVNQEVDALETIGISPLHVLVIPRVDALVLALPLLTFFGDIMALMGGAVTCYFFLDISLDSFLQQMKSAVPASHLWIGLFKAPIFAFMIGMIGCYEGLKVSGSAESVGVHTTRSVVKAIFVVIVLDAIFSVLFAYLDV